MTAELSSARRAALAGIGLAISFALLRPQLSAALVVRGDEMLYRGETAAALSFYRRALFFDRDETSAVDRVAFVTVMQHRRVPLESCMAVTSAYLRRHQDATIVMDRALCELLLKYNAAAERDFAHVASMRRDARAFVFAGFAALHRRDRAQARHYWEEALDISPEYLPAVRALRLR